MWVWAHVLAASLAIQLTVYAVGKAAEDDGPSIWTPTVRVGGLKEAPGFGLPSWLGSAQQVEGLYLFPIFLSPSCPPAL